MAKKLVLFIVCLGLIATSFFYKLQTLGTDWITSHDGAYVYKENIGSSITLVKCNVESKDIIVPSFVDGLKVKTIETDCFDCKNALSITFNDTVKVNEKAFTNCEHIFELSINDDQNLAYGFDGLENLQQLYINYHSGKMVNYRKAEAVGWYDSLDSIKTVYLANGITHIGNYSFTKMTGLNKMELPESLVSIGDYSFYLNECLDVLELPYGLVSIGENGLNGYCASQLAIPNSVTELKNDCVNAKTELLAYKDSAAANYLTKNNISYKEVDFAINDEYELLVGNSFKLEIDDSLNADLKTADNDIININSDAIISAYCLGNAEVEISTKTFKEKVNINVICDDENENVLYQYINVGDSIAINLQDFNLGNNLVYKCEDEAISVDDGIVNANFKGQGLVVVSDEDDNSVDIYYSVIQLMDSIVVKENDIELFVADSYQINAQPLPKDCDNNRLLYRSLDSNICKVDSNGLLSAVNVGETRIEVTDNLSNCKEIINVTVKENEVSLNVNAIALMPDKNFRIKASADKSVNLNYYSSNNNVAKVNSDGVITGVSNGKCFVVVYSTKGNSYSFIDVNVYGDAVSYGIDISKWNGNPSFKAIKNDGIDFVYIRTGYSAPKVSSKAALDSKFEKNYAGAKANGLDVGFYHYILALTVEDAQNEAKQMLKWIKGKKSEYPIMLDIEESSQRLMINSQFNAVVDAYCSIIKDAGYEVIVYSYANMLNKANSEIRSKYDMFVAQYNKMAPENFKYDYTIWQFTSSGKVSGISGRCDMDICFKDYPSYIKENHLNGY